MKVDFSKPDTMRKRFHALSRQAADIRKASAPLRAKHDAMLNRHAKERAALDKKITAAEKGLYSLDMERAALARALGGQTGDPKEFE
jgi:hypothetical protein